MARPFHFYFLILASLGVPAGLVLAQDDVPEPISIGDDAGTPRRHPRTAEEMRQRLERLPPEEREHFRKNLERWQKMSAEQRDRFRQRHEGRLRDMRQEAEKALTDSGLQLDAERRARFIRVYLHERRDIEESLRRETEARREALVRTLIDRLKKQFDATPEPASSP